MLTLRYASGSPRPLPCTMYEVTVPDDALTEEDEDILNYDDIDDPDAFA